MHIANTQLSDAFLLGLCISNLLTCCERENIAMQAVANIKGVKEIDGKEVTLNDRLITFIDYGKAAAMHHEAHSSYKKHLDSIKERNNGAVPMMADVCDVCGMAVDAYKDAHATAIKKYDNGTEFSEEQAEWLKQGYEHFEETYTTCVKEFPDLIREKEILKSAEA